MALALVVYNWDAAVPLMHRAVVAGLQEALIIRVAVAVALGSQIQARETAV